MKPTGVADLNAGVKMKPIEQKIKPIRVGNLGVEVKMKPTGVADLNAGVKMKPIEQKMKPIRVGNPDTEVKMKPTGVGMKGILHFDLYVVVKNAQHYMI